MSFEDRVLKELCDLKKTQESFEARIEKKIETFFNDQLHGNGQSHMHGNGQMRLQGNSQLKMRGNGQSRMHLSRMQYQSRQIQHREPVFPEHCADDFDDFEEMDENFPVDILMNVEELELAIRRDLEFKFRLVIYV